MLDRSELLDDYRWLVSEEGTRWLDRVVRDRESLVTMAERLRKDYERWNAKNIEPQWGPFGPRSKVKKTSKE